MERKKGDWGTRMRRREERTRERQTDKNRNRKNATLKITKE